MTHFNCIFPSYFSAYLDTMPIISMLFFLHLSIVNKLVKLEDVYQINNKINGQMLFFKAKFEIR